MMRILAGLAAAASAASDHLTKWASKEKLEASVAYANGSELDIAAVIMMANLAALKRRLLRVLILYTRAPITTRASPRSCASAVTLQ